MLEESRERRLLPYLERHVPRPQWAGALEGFSLLHYAAQFGDEAALVALMLHVPREMVNSPDYTGKTPAHVAAAEGRPRTLRLLISAGAVLSVDDCDGLSPLDAAVQRQQKESICVLLENGARLEALRSGLKPYIRPWAYSLQAGVDKCRQLTIIFLGIKHSRTVLREFDKFVILMIVRDIWMTRGQKEWQPASGICSDEECSQPPLDWDGCNQSG